MFCPHESKHGYDGGEYETLRPIVDQCLQESPLFKGLSRVVIFTDKAEKSRGLGWWLEHVGGSLFHQGLIKIESVPLVGKESDVPDPYIVAQDKHRRGLSALEGKFGGETLATASDGVPFYVDDAGNLLPMLKLEREGKLFKVDLREEANLLVRRYCRGPFLQGWDIVTPWTRPESVFMPQGLKVGLGLRIIALFEPLEEARVREAVEEYPGDAKKIATRLKMIDSGLDGMANSINQIGFLPLIDIKNRGLEITTPMGYWSDLIRWCPNAQLGWYKAVSERMVIDGLPYLIMGRLLNAPPGPCPQTGGFRNL